MSAHNEQTTTDAPTTDHERVTKLEDRLEDALDRIDDLEATVADQEETIDEQADRIEELESELDERAAVRWDDPNPRELRVENTETNQEITPLSKVYENTEELEELEEDLTQVKLEGVDAADLVGLTGDDEPALPIEDTIAALRSEVRDDPSANKARATVIFQAFGGRAASTKGGKLVLKSTAARSILEDPDKGDMADVNNNTLKRTMHQCAKLTSPNEKPRNRDARSPHNLLTIEERGGKLALVADKDEWFEYLEEVEERYQ